MIKTFILIIMLTGSGDGNGVDIETIKFFDINACNSAKEIILTEATKTTGLSLTQSRISLACVPTVLETVK